MELQKGYTLQSGKYTIEKKLGSGSFGITYLATMKAQVTGSLGAIETTVPVAIKEFFMSELNSRSADGSLVEGSQNTLVTNYRRKFRTEAENLGRMEHPNIVKVLEVWDENNTTYYSMEYVDGVSLDDYIRQQGHIPEPKAIEMFSQLADAVQYMHSKRMLHLDIKPKNAMLRKDGNLLLIDFGLSKQYDANGDPESSTRVGGGTPGYAPIEQADFHDGKGFPVTMDIYALGATLFKMLTGQTPPTASAIVSDGFPVTAFEKGNVSLMAIDSVKKAMSPSKHSRYQMVNEMLVDLNANTSIKDTSNNPVIDDEKTSLDEMGQTSSRQRDKTEKKARLGNVKDKTAETLAKTKEWIKDQNIGEQMSNVKDKVAETLSEAYQGSKEWVKEKKIDEQVLSAAISTAKGIRGLFQRIKENIAVRKAKKKDKPNKHKWLKSLLITAGSILLLLLIVVGTIAAIYMSNNNKYYELRTAYNYQIAGNRQERDVIENREWGNDAFDYYGCRWFISENGKCGLAKSKDFVRDLDLFETLEPCIHDYIGHDGGFNMYEYSHCEFANQRFLVEDHGKMGFVDGDFNWIVPQKYPVTDAEHLYGEVTSMNNYYVNKVFFASGLQPLKNNDNGKWGYVDHNGNLKVPFQYDDAYPFHFNMAKVGLKDSTGEMKYGFINSYGDIIVAIEYEDVEHFHIPDITEGNDFCYANVYRGYRYKVVWKPIDTHQANFLIAQYNDFGSPAGNPVYSTQPVKFRDGMGIFTSFNDASVIFGGREWGGLIGYEGNLILPTRYDKITFDHKGWAKVTGNGESFMINRDGERK